jgi:hypothetical protein
MAFGCFLLHPYPDQMARYYGFDIHRFQIALLQHMAAELLNASEQQAIIEARQRRQPRKQARRSALTWNRLWRIAWRH